MKKPSLIGNALGINLDRYFQNSFFLTMPLRALVNGKEVLAPFIDDDEWEALKTSKPSIILPNCGHNAFPRKSKLGTKHFVHKTAKSCSCSSETWQHLLAKTEIAKACLKMGYEVKTEFSGLDWRADVYAVKQTPKQLIKLAFEVQWSRQSLEETQLRQAKYVRDGVRCCWLFRRLPSILQSELLPMFQLEFVDNSLEVYCPAGMISISIFIEKLLSGQFRFCGKNQLREKQSLNVIILKAKCSKCESSNTLYFLQGKLLSICGRELKISITINDTRLICELFGKEEANKIFSKISETLPDVIHSFGGHFDCIHCYCHSALYQTSSRAKNAGEFEISRVGLFNVFAFSNRHIWCYSPDRVFCCT